MALANVIAVLREILMMDPEPHARTYLKVRLETTFDFSDPQKFDICAWGGEVLRPRVTHDYIRLKIEAPAAF